MAIIAPSYYSAHSFRANKYQEYNDIFFFNYKRYYNLHYFQDKKMHVPN